MRTALVVLVITVLCCVALVGAITYLVTTPCHDVNLCN